MAKVAASWMTDFGANFRMRSESSNSRKRQRGELRKMVQIGDRYLRDEHGLLVEKVGPWAVDKLKIVTDYVQASSAARRRYLKSEATYIDVFCGPGRSKIRDTDRFIDGSPVAAFKKAKGSVAPFTSINVSDADPEILATTEKRLLTLGAPIRAIPGPASLAMPKITKGLNRYGLHFAFLRSLQPESSFVRSF